MKPDKFLTEALTRIEVLHAHIAAVQAAAFHVRRRDLHKKVDTGTLESDLIAAELDEWRNVFMFGLVVDAKTRRRVKAAAHARFLREDMSVSHWFNDGVPASQWLVADEEKFRAMTKKAFGGDE